jgi:hypothetical protein
MIPPVQSQPVRRQRRTLESTGYVVTEDGVLPLQAGGEEGAGDEEEYGEGEV